MNFSARSSSENLLQEQGLAGAGMPGGRSEDLELMARVASGEQAAQRIVATRLIGRVRCVCRGLLRHAADADDATQMGLVAILRAARTYRGDSSIERWAERIAARTAMQLVRERKRSGTRVEDDIDFDDVPGPQSGASVSDRTPQELQVHLAELGDNHRTVLVLRHVLEYSIEEISEMTGASVNTVKDRLLRAREQLRKRIRREDLVGMAVKRAE
jgi:RNA polymerase sigma-70 factor, ECF subfamily